MSKEGLPKRDEKGRLLPGHTANPNGRPKKKSFAEYFNEEERQDLINKIKTSDKPEIWMKVVEQIFGKPKQPIVGGDEDDNPINITISKEIADKYEVTSSSK